MKINCTRWMQRTLLRQTAHRAESHCRPLIYLFTTPAEDRAHLEQAHLAHIAMQVARDHAQHPRHQRRPKHARLFAEWIAEWNYEARLRRRQHSLRSGTKGAGNRLMKSSRKKCPPHRGFVLRPGQRLQSFTKRRQRVRKAVVPVDACNFLDKIDLALQVKPPTRQRHLPSCVIPPS